jgi:hypothetical protein
MNMVFDFSDGGRVMFDVCGEPDMHHESHQNRR